MRQKTKAIQRFKSGLICSLSACLGVYLWGCQAVPGSPANPLSALVNRAMGILSPAQEISLKDAPHAIQFHLDAEGNGLVSSYTLASTEAQVIQNYRYQPTKKNLFFSQPFPTVLWEKPGKGTLFSLANDRIPGPGMVIPAVVDRRVYPLTLGKLTLDNYEATGKVELIEYLPARVELYATPRINEQGNGLYSGVVNTNKGYILAYIPIQNFQLQKNLVQLTETFQSKETPTAFFNSEQGLVIYKTEENTWKVKEIHQLKIQSQETTLASSPTYPQTEIDSKGNGSIALQTSENKWDIHTFKAFKRIKNELIEFKHPPNRTHQMVVFDGAGLLLSYNQSISLSSSAETNLELSYFAAGKVQRTQSLRFPHNGRFPYGVGMHINPQGQGLLAIGSSAKGAAEGKLHLFPIKDFGL
jgi:hypothetical protein